ncbi:MAG TPA: orotidine-5'-phosphate decarboxylase [Spirochaetota bacterium]|nr:orotidine-5'-phosphate decarboxylase [Spirochaetota bacterium]
MKKNPVIVPLDSKDEDQARKLVDQLGESITFYKVGSVLFTRSGKEIIAFLKAEKKKIFLDLKFHDIPNTVKGACYQGAVSGADMLTIHLSGGRQMIKAALQGVYLAAADFPEREINTAVLGVSVLTSIDQTMFTHELRITGKIGEHVAHLVKTGMECGMSGIVCSPHETAAARRRHGSDLIIVNPGIRMPEDDPGDQKRVTTPAQAMASGADFLVIGRSITSASDPRAKAEKILASIRDYTG